MKKSQQSKRRECEKTNYKLNQMIQTRNKKTQRVKLRSIDMHLKSNQRETALNERSNKNVMLSYKNANKN